MVSNAVLLAGIFSFICLIIFSAVFLIEGQAGVNFWQTQDKVGKTSAMFGKPREAEKFLMRFNETRSAMRPTLNNT